QRRKNSAEIMSRLVALDLGTETFDARCQSEHVLRPAFERRNQAIDFSERRRQIGIPVSDQRRYGRDRCRVQYSLTNSLRLAAVAIEPPDFDAFRLTRAQP